jgi:hypothetical protein
MARLLAVPIRDKGDAVLIVSSSSGAIVFGFVTATTLREHFPHSPTICECMAFVELNLALFEQILLRKSGAEANPFRTLGCVEIEASDLQSALPERRERDLILQ